MLESAIDHPVEAVLAVPLLVIGLSHIFQAAVWQDFFSVLHDIGQRGVIWRTFLLELWPAAMIIAFHQEWTWPGIALTLYGHALMAKITVGMLAPEIGLRSLAMAKTHGNRGFAIVGIVLCVLSAFCFVRLIG